MESNVISPTVWLILAILGAIGGIYLVLRFVLPRIKKLYGAIRLKMTKQNKAGTERVAKRMDLSMRMLYSGIMIDKIPVEVLKRSLSRKFETLRFHIENCPSSEDKEAEIEEFGQWYMGCLISYASVAKIRFDELAPLIVKSLGLELAGKVVSRHHILEHYGQGAIATWVSRFEKPPAG